MNVLIILALIGSTYALQFPVEYEYDYRGVIATGIPSIRAQVSATGIRATLKLQMKSKSQGIAKLENIKVGNFNGDAGCVELREPVPIKYSELRKYNEELTKPFGINFAEQQGHVMTVPKEDLEFMTNIRKSIIGVLRVDSILNKFSGAKRDPITQSSDSDFPTVFSAEEETIFGRCECQYSVTRLPSHVAKEEKEDVQKYLKEDEQAAGSRSQGDLPTLQDNYFRLIKSVSFDKCHDTVILMHSGVSNSSKVGYGQYNSVQSRSSVSSYLLKGDEKNLRIERAIVEGDIILNPFGFKLERLQAITNQTLRIVSAKSLGTALRLPKSTRNVRTWRYEVASPFSAPSGSPKMWVNYYNKGDRFVPVPALGNILGFYEKKIEKSQLKHNLTELVQTIVEEVERVPRAPEGKVIDPSRIEGFLATTRMMTATSILRKMEVKDIEEVFEAIFRKRDVRGEKEQMLLVDLMAASGAAPSLKVLLEKIKQGKISNARIASIFATLTNHLVSPVIIPELMEYAMSLDVESEPVVAATVLVNFGVVAHRVCFSHDSHNYSVANPIYGKEICRADKIHDFLEHLSKKTENAKKDWHKAIYLEALSSLGTSHVLSVLRKYITAEVPLPIKLRMITVYALNRRKMPASLREEVFDTLMRIVDDLEEDPEIRQGAVAVLLSWHPDSAWWQRMARLTWREPSQSMAAFFTFTAEKMALSTDPRLAKQSSIAAFVLPLMKPFSASLKYSYNYIYSRYDPINEIATNANFATLENMESIVPSEVYASLRNSFGGFEFNIFEIASSMEGLDKPFRELLDLFNIPQSERRPFPYSPRDAESRRHHNDMDEEDDEKKPMANIYARSFDHITAFYPFNKESLSKIVGEDAERLIRELIRGVKVNATKYLNPLDLSYFVPSEIGLPIIGSASLPTMNLGNAEVRLEISGSPRSASLKDLMRSQKVHLLFKSNYKFMSKVVVSLKTLVPWDETIIEAEVQNYKEINLPVYGNLTYHHSDEIKNLTLNLAPHVKEAFPIIYANNIPSTNIKPLSCSTSTKDAERIVIAVQRERSPVMDVEQHAEKETFGLKASLRYRSDKPYPFTRYLFLDYLRKPEKFFKLMFSPTSKQWESYILINPRESSTRNVSLSISYLTPRKSEDSNEELLRSRKPDSRRSSSIPDISAADSERKRLEKLEEMSAGRQVRAISAQLFFNGTEFRKYEALVAFTKTSEEESKKKEFKTLLAVLSLRNGESKALCLEADTETSDIESLEELRSEVSSGLKETVQGRLYQGGSCSTNSKSIASFEGHIKMTEERKRSVYYELKNMCAFDQVNPVVELQTPAIYDDARIQISYKEEDVPRHLLNVTYKVEKMLEGLVYPHAYYNKLDVRNPKGKLTIEARRPMTSKFFSFYAQKPTENIIIEELPISNFLTRIVPFIGLNVHKDRHSKLVVSRESSPSTCQISGSQVNTFDGLKYSYEPLNCYTTVSTDKKGSERFIIRTRQDQNGNQEIRVDMAGDVTVTAQKDSATVNGNSIPSTTNKFEVKDHHGRTVIVLYRKSDHFRVEVKYLFDIIVADTISVTPTLKALKAKLAGLCGDFDGTTTFDLRGPKGCIYRGEEELFKYAWTIAEGKGCNTDDLNTETEKVREFQENCNRGMKKRSQKKESPSDDEMDKECVEYVYPIEVLVRGSDICVANEPVMRCAKHCKVVAKKTVERSSKCWDPKHVPQEVKDSLEEGFLKHKTSDPAKYSKSIEFKAAKECSRKNM